MPHDPTTGKRLRGRPSNKERLERPDIFNPAVGISWNSFLPPLPVDPATGKRRRGQPTCEEQQARFRLLVKAELQRAEIARVQEGAVLDEARHILAVRRNEFGRFHMTLTKDFEKNEYASILFAQNGRCAACLVPLSGHPSKSGDRPILVTETNVDVRFLICPECHALLNVAGRKLDPAPSTDEGVSTPMGTGDVTKEDSHD